MADFFKAFPLVMHIEGGTADDPADTGGFTYKGIAYNKNPGWKGWQLLFKLNPNKLVGEAIDKVLEASQELQSLVLSFYKSCYWDVLSLDAINDQRIATELFDTSVNMGSGIGALFLQQSLNLNNCNATLYPDIAEDRKVGPQTIKYCNDHKRPNELFKTLNVLQGARYIEICRNNPKQEKFWRSWLSRVTTAY